MLLKTPIFKLARRCFQLSCLLLLPCLPLSGQVVINEVVADNELGFLDGIGGHYDWLELYNPGEQPVALLGWHLSDDPTEPQLWQLPDLVLPPKGYLLLIASGDSGFDGSYWHANFKLDKDGEALLLTRPDGNPADLFPFPALDTDEGFGRFPDGSDALFFFEMPTPGGSNAASSGQTPFWATSLAFSQQPGHYPGGLSLGIWANQSGVDIRYTLDGSEPQLDDALFEDSLLLDASNLPDVHLAYLPTSDDWSAPSGEVATHHVVRARAFRDGHPDSDVLTGSFFAEQTFPYSLPVVSIVTEPGNLFDDESGIYHKGLHENYAQRGDAWERPAHFEFFDENGQLRLSQSIGIRTNGFTTRAYPQKTLKLYARSEYGTSRFEYPLFGENYDSSFKRLLLRTITGDWSQMGFSDDLCHELLVGEVDVEYTRRRFVVVLVNGEYWGLHSLRQPIDQYFMAQEAGVDDELLTIHNNWDTYAEQGDADDYMALLDYLNTHDLSDPAHFEEVANRIDLDNFVDYHVLQIAFANADWPNNNVKFWKPQLPGAKWRWATFDLDGSLKAANHTGHHLYFSEVRHHLTDWQRREKSFFMLRKLLDYEPFRRRFVARLNAFLGTTLSPDRTLPLLHRMVGELSAEMPRHIRRWHFPKGMKDWQRGIKETEHFLLNRPPFLLEDAFEWFGPSVKVYPNPTTGPLHLDVFAAVPTSFRIEVLNGVGQAVFTAALEVGVGDSTLDFVLPNGLPAGLYCLRLSDGRLSWVEKVVGR